MRDQIVGFLAKYSLHELAKIADLGLHVSSTIASQAIQEPGMLCHDVLVDIALRFQHSRNRYDETNRLDVFKPFDVSKFFR